MTLNDYIAEAAEDCFLHGFDKPVYIYLNAETKAFSDYDFEPSDFDDETCYKTTLFDLLVYLSSIKLTEQGTFSPTLAIFSAARVYMRADNVRFATKLSLPLSVVNSILSGEREADEDDFETVRKALSVDRSTFNDALEHCKDRPTIFPKKNIEKILKKC